MDKFYKIILLLFMLAATVLFIFPQIDIQVEQLLYRPEVGFYLNNLTAIQFIYKIVPMLIYIVLTSFILLFVWIHVTKHKVFRIGNREIIYLLLVLLIGPGLLVNFVFKDHFGRARPYQIVNFGGDKQFSRPLVIANQCKKNCSFPSGHAATGFYFVALALLWQRRKKLMVSLAILFGFIVGLGRMLQGGHFLSDVIYSGLIVLIVSYILYYYLINRSFSEIKT